jgi:hypothetical protein
MAGEAARNAAVKCSVEVFNRPTALPRIAAQGAIGVDHHGMSDRV